VTFRIEGWCHLGEKMEVYDAEIHVVAEGLVATASDLKQPHNLIICIDNSATVLALSDSTSTE
jgi:hypothetical protein